jgi:type III restriction enzyme
VKFEFDSAQQYQINAIESTVGLFAGQNVDLERLSLTADSEMPIIGNRLDISASRLLANLQDVQHRNSLPVDDELHFIGESRSDWVFPNFTVEMETGTGKTYVYLRSALELCQKFGFRKFIIVVPTIAIRAGVLKTLEVTVDHFAELYGDVPYRFQVYDSRFPARIRQFSASLGLEFLIMTIDSFNRDNNRFFVPSDYLHGEPPVKIAQETRPILILDEPQNMGSAASIEALSSLKPLFALRYSATHRDRYNLIYQLTPVDAYRQGIVKQIEVAGVERETDANRAFLEVLSIDAGKRRVTAKLRVHVMRGASTVKPRKLVVKPGTDLETVTGRPEYRDYVVDEINPVMGLVRFVNNVELAIGDSQGGDRSTVFDSQIRYTIREHFFKQRRLRSHGIKVLSLFFIDKVVNYSGENPIIRTMFDAAFNELKADFQEWEDFDSGQVQAAYFAKRKKGGKEELVDTITAAAARDKEAFELIMRNKERLLSFDEPVSFIFSHSALREGWDNPNVCQICTLNQTFSEMKKRQEIGRGIRLVVDQSGKRLLDPKVNILTVVANDSYENYVSRYQEELAEDFDFATGTAKPGNARMRKEILLRETVTAVPAFQRLWNRIRRKTRYTVRLDMQAEIPRIVRALDASDIQPVRVRVAKGRVVAGEQDMFDSQVISGSRTLAISTNEGTLDGVIDKTLELLEQGSMPLRLTRRTILQIYSNSSTQEIALANPHEWASTLAAVIREQLGDRLVEFVDYEEIDDSYDLTQFESTVWSWEDRVIPSKHGLYDHTVWESDVEQRFAAHLDNDPRTLVYLKFPGWFTVDTPVGPYTPDWAVVREEVDEHGKALGAVGFVAETKATLDQANLRPKESRKIACAHRHFETVDVPYRAVRSLAEYDLLDVVSGDDVG